MAPPTTVCVPRRVAVGYESSGRLTTSQGGVTAMLAVCVSHERQKELGEQEYHNGIRSNGSFGVAVAPGKRLSGVDENMGNFAGWQHAVFNIAYHHARSSTETLSTAWVRTIEHTTLVRPERGLLVA